jgi:hypothetical protein
VFVAKTVFNFWYLVVIAASVLVCMYNALRLKKVPHFRRIAGLDAIEEAVGRAAEMGRPIHFCPGTTGLTDTAAAQTFAGLAILGHTTKVAAQMGVPVIVTIRAPEVLPVAEETVNQAYIAAGKAGSVPPNTVRYAGMQGFALATYMFAVFTEEKPAANFLIGNFTAEGILLAEVGSFGGAVQIAGTARAGNITDFVTACDYTLIGEELFAGAAYVSNNTAQMGSIQGQDIAKLVTIAVIILGALQKMTGSAFLDDLMKF